MTGPSRRLIDYLSDVDPERRRLWAARLLIFSVVGWVASHVVLEVVDEGGFFNHVLMAISWWAVGATCADVVQTADVRAEVDDE